MLIRPYKALYCSAAWEPMTKSTEAYQNSAETPMRRERIFLSATGDTDSVRLLRAEYGKKVAIEQAAARMILLSSEKHY